MQTSLPDLPPELVEEILIWCDPVDVAKASMTCRKVYEVVYGRPLPLDSDVLDLSGGVGCAETGKRKRGLWREMYLNQGLDDLSKCVNWLGIPRVSNSEEEERIDWEKELQSVIRARTVVLDARTCRGEEDLKDVLRTLLKLVEWVPPVYTKGDLAQNLVWVPVMSQEFFDLVEGGIPLSFRAAFLPSPSPSTSTATYIAGKEPLRSQWKLPPRPRWMKETRQLYAQLHTLYGLARCDLTTKRRVESRAWVYDMRKYKPENDYGPLKDGAKCVDWEFLERIHHVMSMHIVWERVKDWIETGVDEGVKQSTGVVGNGSEGGERKGREEGAMKVSGFGYIVYPMSLPSTQTVCPDELVRGGEGYTTWGGRGKGKGGVRGVPLVQVTEEKEGELPEGADWAGIGGIWAICFCFCDHRELIDFNRSGDTSGRLDVSLFEDEEFTEVFRRIEVNLKVTRVANDPEHPGRPIIGFVGEIRPPSISTMYGVVQLTKDNHIKWQFYSGEMGSGAIWSSIGIQVGGVGSSYGILGSWTTVFHDDDDPVGPFWMQKQ